MNYRSRWQERRRKEAQKRLAMSLAAVACLVLGIALADRLTADTHLWLQDLHLRAPVFFTHRSGVLYCTSPGRLAQALSLRTGRPLWSEPHRPYMGSGGPPVVAGSRVIVFSDDGRATSLDRVSGEPGWQMGTGYTIRGAPLVFDNLLYFGCDDGNVYAIDARTGMEIWRAYAKAPVNSGFAEIRQGLMFGTADGRILCVNAKTGTPARWRVRRLGLSVNVGPVPAGQDLLFGTDGGRAYLVDPVSGMVTRYVEMPGMGLVRAQPVADRKGFYVATTDGWILACDQEGASGPGRMEPRWAKDIGREVSAGPVLHDGLIYCGNGGSYVLALDARTGHIVDRWKCPAPVRGSIVVADGVIAAGTEDGQVAAFQAPEARQ